MTTLIYRPEPALSLAETPTDGPTLEASSELDSLKQEMRDLVMPLTRVYSLDNATRVAASVTPGYIDLASRWARSRMNNPLPQDYEAQKSASPLVDSIRMSALLSNRTKETLCGALESSRAYFDWIGQRHADIQQNAPPRLLQVLEHVGPVIAGAEATFLAIGLTLAGTPNTNPKSLMFLARFVDRCWTEVEDYFLGLALSDTEGVATGGL